MRRIIAGMKSGLVAGAILSALVGCNQEASSDATAPTAAVAPATTVQPATSAPAPASDEPAVSSMIRAEAPQKLGAPVELRYQFDGDVKAGRPVTLHLAAVPGVPGSNLMVSIKKESGISIADRDLTEQKVSASVAYRQQLLVTRLVGGPAELHVLVTMEVPEGSAHSWFRIPFEGTPATGKQQPLKLE